MPLKLKKVNFFFFLSFKNLTFFFLFKLRPSEKFKNSKISSFS